MSLRIEFDHDALRPLVHLAVAVAKSSMISNGMDSEHIPTMKGER